MARIEVRVEDHTKEVERAVNNAIEAALEACGLQAEGNVLMNLTKSIPHIGGRREGKELIYNYPINDSGTLAKSITHSVDASDQAVYVGTNVEYAPYVEMGTSKSAPYPYLKPALENHVDEYEQIFEKYLNDIG